MKMKDLKSIDKKERQGKVEELKLELIKARVNAPKTGGSKVKEIKKTIARIITLEKMEEEPKIKLLKRKISKDKS